MGDRGRQTTESATSTGQKKKRMRSKSTKRVKLTPMQQRVKEIVTFLQPHQEEILEAKTVKDRLIKVYELMSPDQGDITRIWPLKLTNKDSRIRRELSEKASECIRKGDQEQGLKLYNQALMYSTGKGIAHTLARRAAHFLSSDQLNLALRDLSAALDYGCLQHELLDFLLLDHIPKNSAVKYTGKYKWAENIKEYLDTATRLQRSKTDPKKMREVLDNIVTSIQTAAKEQNVDENMEFEELEVPVITERNPLIPAMSEALAVSFDSEKGRIIKARRDIKAGELLCVDSPICSLLCPDSGDHLASHCSHCFKKTKAPLPCETCCTVSYCSKDCLKAAQDTYHKFECQLRLYEVFPQESREMFSLFMALRSITQKPLQYFTEQKQDIEKYLELSKPVHPLPVRAYQSSDYRAFSNLQTHVDDLDEDVALKHAILSVFFFRSLQFAGYFGTPGYQGNILKKVEPLNETELYMLRLIHQIINIQTYNTHAIHELSEQFVWDKIGISINPSMALVNHSCDPNTIRCNLNKNTILVAGQHIKQGDEITDSYSVHFKNTTLSQRQFHTLKYYMFECECKACMENWPLEDEVPEELPRVPNFDQEILFKERQGDKKDIVKSIIDARRRVESLMGEKKHEETLVAYQPLCEQLEIHVRKPHILYLQARTGISHCLWNIYCKQKNKDDILGDEEDITGRDHAVKIYQSDFMEKPHKSEFIEEKAEEKKTPVMINGEAVWPTKAKKNDDEKKKLLDAIKNALINTTADLGSVKSDHMAMKDSIQAMKDIAKEHSDMEKVGDIDRIITDAEFAQLVKQKEEEAQLIREELAKFQEEMSNVEKEIRERKEKEREELMIKREEEKKRKQEEKEKQIEEKMKLYKEEEAKRKEKTLLREMETKKKMDEKYKKKIEDENKKHEENLRKRRNMMMKEEEELQELLALAIEDENETKSSKEIDTKLSDENDTRLSNEHEYQVNKNSVENGNDSKLSKECIQDQRKTENAGILDGKVLKTGKTEIISKQLKNSGNNQRNEPSNSVWAALRDIKELSVENVDLSIDGEKEKVKVDEDSFDSLIKEIQAKRELAKQVTNLEKSNNSKIKKDEKIKHSVSEKEEKLPKEKKNIDSSDKYEEADLNDESKISGETVAMSQNISKQAFDYDAWSKDIEKYFKDLNEAEVKAKADDEAYLLGLKNNINDRIQKEFEKKKVNSVNDGPLFKPKTKPAKPVKPKEEMNNLKQREKERKRKKREEKFKETEDKMRDVAIKTEKIDRIVKGADEEIVRMRNLTEQLILRSLQYDKEPELLEIETLNSASSRGDDLKNNTNMSHWTEEEINKWPSQEEKRDFSSALSVLKNAAQGKTIITEKLKSSISNVKNANSEDSMKDKEKRTEKANLLAVSVNENKAKTVINGNDCNKTVSSNQSILTNSEESNKNEKGYTKISQKKLPKSDRENTEHIEKDVFKSQLAKNISVPIVDKKVPVQDLKNKNGTQKLKKISENNSLSNSEKQVPKTNENKTNDIKELKLHNFDLNDDKEGKLTFKEETDKKNKSTTRKTIDEVGLNKEVLESKTMKSHQIKKSKEMEESKGNVYVGGNSSLNSKEKVEDQKASKSDSHEQIQSNKTFVSETGSPKEPVKETFTKSEITDETSNRQKNYAISKVATEKVIIPKPEKNKENNRINEIHKDSDLETKEMYSITKEPTQNIVIMKSFQKASKNNDEKQKKEETQQNTQIHKEISNIEATSIKSTKVEKSKQNHAKTDNSKLVSNCQVTDSKPNGRPVTKLKFNNDSSENTKEILKKPDTVKETNKNMEKFNVLHCLSKGFKNAPNSSNSEKDEIKDRGNIIASTAEGIISMQIDENPYKNKDDLSKLTTNDSNAKNGSGNINKSKDIIPESVCNKSPKIPIVVKSEKDSVKPEVSNTNEKSISPKSEEKVADMTLHAKVPQDSEPSNPKIEKTDKKFTDTASDQSMKNIHSKPPVSSKRELLPNTSSPRVIKKELSTVSNSPTMNKKPMSDVKSSPSLSRKSISDVPDSPKGGGIFFVTPNSFVPTSPAPVIRRPPPPKSKPPPPPPLF